MNKDHEKPASACSTPIAATQYELSDTFYTNQQKGHVFRVRLNGDGFTLQRESPSGTKEQVVKICDIVGGRCMRLKQSRRSLANACACSSGNSSSSPAASARVHSGATGDTPSKCSAASREEYHRGGATADYYDGDVSAYLYVFAYVLKKKSLRSTLHRERTVLRLRFRSFDTFDDNMREAERWYRALRWQLHHTLEEIFVTRIQDERRRRVLVLLNPKSGSGKAREMFNMHVCPVFNEAEVPYDLYVTKHSNYASEFVRTRPLNVWCCVVAVGGDGLFHEILNGLLQREDWAQILRTTALGIVPCGSGNGLAKSIAHTYNEPYSSKPILGSVLTIISGQTTAMDVVRVDLPDRTIYSFLSIGWGLISDIDIESERLRILGYQRFTLWTLHRLVSLRTYNGKISYLPIKEHQPPQDNLLQPLKAQLSRSCTMHIDKLSSNQGFHQSAEFLPQEFEDVISLETSINHSFRSRCDSWLSNGSRRSFYYSISESVYHSLADESDCIAASSDNPRQAYGPASNIPKLEEPLPLDEGWCVEEGQFVMMHAAYQTHLGTDCHFVPKAQLNDGTIYLIIIRTGISRPQLLNFLINMSSGTHLPEKNGEFVKVLPVRAFRLEPYDDHGIITVDGELVEFGPLQAEVLPGIARVTIPK
ncbi:sphingosine kinase 2 [Scaptodrosophila lebanonensis]|uniref:sphingosine kinase n=1 Tax=Drosophila lebanonensis TaxID=7225 RepID=A0A6J2UE27_DROLE|nr:sphingosine kinase 2 [Scaptodrosophila lebanonensis]